MRHPDLVYDGELPDLRPVPDVPLFPVGVGLASQAPLLGLIANPPDATARDEMLSSWCAADYCTLLGGGAGYGGASAFPGNYVEPDEEAK